MKNSLTLRLGRDGVFRLPSGGHEKRKRTGNVRGNGCPQWLADKYRKFSPSYAYFEQYERSDLERVRYWPDTGEWVAVYYSYVYQSNNPQSRWTERYIWVWRGGKMVELKQFGVPNGWRSRTRGWNS